MGTQKSVQLGVLLLCMLAGLTVGYFLGNLCNEVSFLSWLGYEGHFGLDQPVQVDLGVIWFSFQIRFKFTLTSIVGMLMGIFVYKKIK